ncbi:cell surface protein [Bacillus sp. ISL-4]|uniref:cell surface protein n=1 Tax=Bacillus sp. ISL-4 TaxID=2819125 RepID=UPI001BEAB174|nr:cell surface protein [Bacillus sp. ISL-4]MBT2667687.1 cell surface protein [Bacillus sp. ISL-4]MBT2672272.1 hypothetical protein [Streptomyces sp. ISL-14]
METYILLKKKITVVVVALIIISFSIFASISSKEPDAATVIVKTLTWDLVDSGRHMDWGGSSKYSTNFTSGVSVWNNYKSGVIRKDTASTIQDVKISDYSQVSQTAGVTSSVGTIKFN